MPEQADAVVGDDLPACIEGDRFVASSRRRHRTRGSSPGPSSTKCEGARAHHVGIHVLVRLAGDDSTVGLDRVLAHDGCRRRVHDPRQEPARRLLQGHFEREVIDDLGVLDDVGEQGCATFGEIHLDHAVPRVLHIVGRQLGAVVERAPLLGSGTCRSVRPRTRGRSLGWAPRSRGSARIRSLRRVGQPACRRPG